MPRTPAQEAIDQEVVDTLSTQLADMQRRRDELTVRATIDGELIAPTSNCIPGYLQKGQEICTIARVDELTVKVLLQQGESQLIMGRVNKTAVRFAGDLSTAVPAVRRIQLRQRHWIFPVPPSPNRPAKRSRSIPKIRPSRRPSSLKWMFRWSIPAVSIIPASAYVRFTLDDTPLFVQWKRRFLQVLQTKNNPWM